MKGRSLTILTGAAAGLVAAGLLLGLDTGQAGPSIGRALVLATPSGEPPGNALSMDITYNPPSPGDSPVVTADEAVQIAEDFFQAESQDVFEVQPVLAQYSKVSYLVDENDNPTKKLTSEALVWAVRIVGPCLDDACAYRTNYVVVDAMKGTVITAYPDEAEGDAVPGTT
jgi:hypothetical protein